MTDAVLYSCGEDALDVIGGIDPYMLIAALALIALVWLLTIYLTHESTKAARDEYWAKVLDSGTQAEGGFYDEE